MRSENSYPNVDDYSIEFEFHSVDGPAAASARLQFMDFVYGNYSTRVNDTDLELVYSELVANVMKHAPGLVRVGAYVSASGHVTLEVSDTGPEFALVPLLPIDPFSTTGRGLYIISQLCDELTLARCASGNRIIAKLHFVMEPRSTSELKVRDIPYYLFTRFRCLVRR